MGVRVSGLQFSGQVAHGTGVCELSLPWRNNLSLYVNDIDNSSFSMLMMLTTAIVVVLFWLIGVQLAPD